MTMTLHEKRKELLAAVASVRRLHKHLMSDEAQQLVADATCTSTTLDLDYARHIEVMATQEYEDLYNMCWDIHEYGERLKGSLDIVTTLNSKDRKVCEEDES